jgi:hypothetical protein
LSSRPRNLGRLDAVEVVGDLRPRTDRLKATFVEIAQTDIDMLRRRN